MNQKKLVSIIIPIFNGEKYIAETISSVLLQVYKTFEIIVVDDGSSDKSLEILKKIQDNRIYVYNRPNFMPKGGNSCRNYGLEKCHGKYVIFLDSDDILEPFCLEQRVRYMENNQHLDFAVFNMRNFTKNHNDGYVFTKLMVKNPLVHFLSYHVLWQTTAPIWKVSFLKKIGGFNLKYERLQDPGLVSRALLTDNVKWSLLPYSKPDALYRIFTSSQKGQKAYNALKQYITDFIPYISDKEHEFKICFQSLFIHFSFFYYKYSSLNDMVEYESIVKKLGKRVQHKYFIIYYLCKHRKLLQHMRHKNFQRLIGKCYSTYIEYIWHNYEKNKI